MTLIGLFCTPSRWIRTEQTVMNELELVGQNLKEIGSDQEDHRQRSQN